MADNNNDCCRYKATPRSERDVRRLTHRLNRMSGQLSGIGRMLEDGRYCGDVLTQVAAVQSALSSFAYEVMREHLGSCVAEEIRAGNDGIVDETVELMRKLR